jgi:hypothetical protein
MTDKRNRRSLNGTVVLHVPAPVGITCRGSSPKRRIGGDPVALVLRGLNGDGVPRGWPGRPDAQEGVVLRGLSISTARRLLRSDWPGPPVGVVPRLPRRDEGGGVLGVGIDWAEEFHLVETCRPGGAPMQTTAGKNRPASSHRSAGRRPHLADRGRFLAQRRERRDAGGGERDVGPRGDAVEGGWAGGVALAAVAPLRRGDRRSGAAGVSGG